MLPVSRGANCGANDTPRMYDVPVSGLRSGLPPNNPESCPPVPCGIVLVVPPLPYCAAVTPLRSHCSSVADADTMLLFASTVGAQGSPLIAIWLTSCGLNNSMMLGARIARWYDARKR